MQRRHVSRQPCFKMRTKSSLQERVHTAASSSLELYFRALVECGAFEVLLCSLVLPCLANGTAVCTAAMSCAACYFCLNMQLIERRSIPNSTRPMLPNLIRRWDRAGSVPECMLWMEGPSCTMRRARRPSFPNIVFGLLLSAPGMWVADSSAQTASSVSLQLVV